MYKYIFGRILGMIPNLFIITILIFSLAKLAPGDPFAMQMDPGISKEDIERQRAMYGIDDPIPKQYFVWLTNVVQGDFGNSLKTKRPVNDLINERIWNTVLLAALSLFITISIAIPLGILSARRPYSLVDYMGTTFSFTGLSIPNFYLGLLLIFVFALHFGWFPSQGTVTTSANYTGFRLFMDKLHHALLPAIAIGTSATAIYFRYMRSEMLEVIQKDFIRTAKSKGVPERKLLFKHTLRNAMIPIITLMGFEFGALVSGAIITEKVFSWPGIGTLFLDSILTRDYPTIMAISLIVAIAILIGNLIADILYSAVDPRIRYN
ncbi:ABC transporter permease [Lederbergia panacisoli]|uniref:ABC transporter permease n=1 Tax=Lederbergia panacisoli TaxID=1255251 RepID=UPI00214B5FFE|nr:ABC transporter permease [Lederbergia panacisoli]MCR2820073.1 ABC transporter permease [Lederbergia panacisoli]